MGGGGGVGRQGTSLPTTGTVKGNCMNHLKLQRQGSLTMANSNMVSVLECMAHFEPSALGSTPPPSHLHHSKHGPGRK